MRNKVNHTDKLAHQRISDHETLCRIMQKNTNKQIVHIRKQIERLEKITTRKHGTGYPSDRANNLRTGAKKFGIASAKAGQLRDTRFQALIK